MEKKKVALVLSGGAALGFAHIGVIKVLKEHNIPIDIVVGTSMGGLVAAAYAVGLSCEEMTDFACKFKNINFFDLNFDSSGIFSGKGMMKSITKFIPDVKIEDLDTRFACVACDLIGEKEYVFKNGSLRDAVRSTISIPGLFTPNKVGDLLLIDGGVVNNLPETVAKSMGADIIISSDVLYHCKLKSAPESLIASLMSAINVMTKIAQNSKPKLGDITLTPNISELGQMSFGKKTALKAIEAGERVTKKNIKKILSLLEEK